MTVVSTKNLIQMNSETLSFSASAGPEQKGFKIGKIIKPISRVIKPVMRFVAPVVPVLNVVSKGLEIAQQVKDMKRKD